jgi:hypothetical protein
MKVQTTDKRSEVGYNCSNYCIVDEDPTPQRKVKNHNNRFIPLDFCA